MSICFLFVFFLSLLLLLRLLGVHSCWGFVCSFASFVDFPFFCWRVSCEKKKFPFYNFNLCTGCQGVKTYFRVLWSVWIYSLLNWQGRRFHPKRPFLPFSKDQPSESRVMRDRYPLVKKSCLCGCPQGNWLGTISSSNLQGWSFLRLLAFGKVWKENNNPLVCSSAHPTAARSRGIFVVDRLMVKTRLIRHSPQWSVCDVRDLRQGSRAYFEIKTSRRNSAWSACISSFVNILTFMALTLY